MGHHDDRHLILVQDQGIIKVNYIFLNESIFLLRFLFL